MQVERESSFDETPRSLLEKAEAIKQRLSQNDANSSSILRGINNIKIKLNNNTTNTLLLIKEINSVNTKKAYNKIKYGSENPGNQKLLLKHLDITTNLDVKLHVDHGNTNKAPLPPLNSSVNTRPDAYEEFPELFVPPKEVAPSPPVIELPPAPAPVVKRKSDEKEITTESNKNLPKAEVEFIDKDKRNMAPPAPTDSPPPSSTTPPGSPSSSPTFPGSHVPGQDGPRRNFRTHRQRVHHSQPTLQQVSTQSTQLTQHISNSININNTSNSFTSQISVSSCQQSPSSTTPSFSPSSTSTQFSSAGSSTTSYNSKINYKVNNTLQCSAETRERIPEQFEDKFISKLMQSDTVQPQNEILTHSVVMPNTPPDNNNSEHGQAQTLQADQTSSAEDSKSQISHSVICQAQPKLDQCVKWKVLDIIFYYAF